MSDAAGDTLNLDVNVNLGIEPVQEGIFASEEDEKAVTTYLTTEINAVLEGKERSNLVAKWQKWRRIAEGRPEQEKKTFPWDNASNLTVPITMNSTHGLFANLKSTFGNREEPWKVTDIKGNSEQARVASLVLNTMAKSRDHLNLDQVSNTIFYDLARMGTQFVKVPWVTDAVAFKRKDISGATQNVLRVRRNSPTVVPIRLENLLTRPYWYDIQRAPWVADAVFLWEHEMLQRKQQGIYLPDMVDKVIASGFDDVDENMSDSLQRAGIEVSGETGFYMICETYVFWDADGDGIPEDLIVWFHPKSGVILRVEYNDLSVRPLVRIPFINIPYQLYGMGTGWLSESMQDEIDALHNLRIDSSTLAAYQMLKRRRGSGGPSIDRDEIRPLKIWDVDEMDDLEVMKFPEPGYGLVQAELLAKEYNDRANQLPDSAMGFENRAIGTRATFKGQQFGAQQSARISNALSEHVEEGWGEIGQIAMFQLVRNSEKAKISIMPMLSEKDQVIFQEILDLNVEDIPTLFSFRVSTVDPTDSDEAKIQQKMTLFEIYSAYAEKMFQAVQIMEGPQMSPKMKELAAEFFVGGTELMTSIFTYFDEKSPGTYLPYIEDIKLMLEYLEEQKEAKLGPAIRERSGQLESGRGSATGGDAGLERLANPSTSAAQPTPEQATEGIEGSAGASRGISGAGGAGGV